MSVIEDLKKTVDTTPFFAAVGVTDLAVEKVRFAGLRASELRTELSADLDEGPIIAQQVREVDHAFTPEDLAAAGRDTECKALSNAVRWHCESRVILSGNRTVILH